MASEPGTAARQGPVQPGSALLVAAAVVAFGFIGSRLLGVVRTTVIANEFGSQPELSAYWVAFRIPDLIFQVLAGATLGSAFIPVFIRIYRRESEKAAWQLASTIITLVTVATAALCVVGFVLAPWLVPLQAPDLGRDIGQHAELTAKAVSLTRLMLLSTFLFAVSGMITGILNARQQFLLPALAPMFYNIAIIGGALLLSGSMGVNGLAVGVVVGAGLHLAIQVPGLVRERMAFRPNFDTKSAPVREVGKLMAPRVLGLAAAQMNFFITTYFASKLSSDAISNLNYAWLIAGLPLAIFGMTISTAVFPTLAEQVAEGDRDALNTTISRALRTIMFFTIPAAIGLLLLREPVTITLLEHGKFTPADTAVTASALGWYCLGIIPQAGIEIHSRGFYALGNTRTPVFLAVGAVVMNLVLSAALWGPFEHEGLAFSVAAASWLEWVLLYVFYHGQTGAAVAQDVHALALFSVCGALMAIILALAHFGLDANGQLHALILLIAGGVAGAALYHGFAAWFDVPNFAEYVGQLKRIVARFRRSHA